ncbi:TetR/AcrR family transcriptional regulator [Streptomyces solisilvae]|uniref:TetR/AcrR family transcriptional regulator n=1 Tax=Streptomyces malaysiensis TaxID=92644 RepID=A0ABX6VZ26_STRMQ|nr:MULTISPECIES: TetR/AcrR family transcriptional regulator [Streptomyces]ATL80747.1 transcriptional regulator, TetR family [Streptomyces malaysiensis]MCM3808596.1 TetR/AcrR family transcriptional regulator [Streptomyces sp. DR7-3]MCQ6249631.1 TetR/AcrR family transcriptional regulator [Streptomyces malaysiensis]QPI54557.1 TetR/AcrR family transcriptional regulator [Streptomyces solisilvae]UHH15959.1 TetR/AcrR family transcriptional regulator [Streptomyces sp. HNM0561]
MGHREQLMAGAKRCLEERGFARTTSRDIAAAANAPLGTINYHYGSKERLLNAALLETLDEWSEKVRSGSAEPVAGSGAGARVESMWARVVESETTDRPLLVASAEALAQAERSAEVRQQLAEAFERARTTLAADLHGIEGAEDGEVARAVGSVHMALIAGLTQQWLVDPERAPSAREVATGLRRIAQALESDS